MDQIRLCTKKRDFEGVKVNIQMLTILCKLCIIWVLREAVTKMGLNMTKIHVKDKGKRAAVDGESCKSDTCEGEEKGRWQEESQTALQF